MRRPVELASRAPENCFCNFNNNFGSKWAASREPVDARGPLKSLSTDLVFDGLLIPINNHTEPLKLSCVLLEREKSKPNRFLQEPDRLKVSLYQPYGVKVSLYKSD